MDVVEEEKKAASKASLDIGALLVEARENKNLTAQNIADDMNLTLSVISKIEENQFVQDIPLAFIRGYVRSYAQKVGVDVETICVEFDRQTGGSVEPVQNLKVVSDFKIRRREINSSSSAFKFITFLIILSLVAFAGWELWKRLSNSEAGEETNTITFATPVSEISGSADSANDTLQTPSTSEETGNRTELSQNIESNDGTVTETDIVEQSQVATEVSNVTRQDVPQQNQTQPNQTRQDQTQQDQTSSDSVTASSSVNFQNDNSQAQASEQILLTEPVKQVEFSFSAECWVQVTDANGQVIAVGTKLQGYVMPLEGVTPFNVILGEPTAVSIKVDGVGFDLSGYRAGRRAQFTID